MGRRAFILLILIVLVVAIIGTLVVFNLRGSGGGGLASLIPGGSSTESTDPNSGTDGSTSGEPGAPAPAVATPTPEPPQFQSVVVSKVRLPVGELITEELLTTEQRPVTNIALRGGYTFTNTQAIVGQITRIEVARGQEILAPMLAANPTDIASFGSDLALHIPSGEVAVAFPIDPLSGLAFSMRPGDTIDVLMTLRTVEIDPEFRSALPNTIQPVIESALLSGQQFIFGEFQEGRLEFISQLNQVAVIGPGTAFEDDRPYGGGPIPKRVTQLSIQNSQVLWVGEWQDPRELERETATVEEGAEGATPEALPSRFEAEPAVVILSMTSQQALSLKWAREQGVDIDLALRAPGDNTTFVTTSVSLPQMIDQGSIAIPDPVNFDIYDGE